MKPAVGIGVGVAVGVASIFVCYCFYFDRKRRNDPEFKQKLRERRKAKKNAQKANSKLVNYKDREVVQRFFLHEIQLGEEFLACGDVSTGVEHLANAVAVCGQPTQLLQVLQKTLPPQAFELLVQRLPTAEQRVMLQANMAEEDVE